MSYLDTSKTSTRVGKKEAKEESPANLLVRHIPIIAAGSEDVKCTKNNPRPGKPEREIFELRDAAPSLFLQIAREATFPDLNDEARALIRSNRFRVLTRWVRNLGDVVRSRKLVVIEKRHRTKRLIFGVRDNALPVGKKRFGPLGALVPWNFSHMFALKN